MTELLFWEFFPPNGEISLKWYSAKLEKGEKILIKTQNWLVHSTTLSLVIVSGKCSSVSFLPAREGGGAILTEVGNAHTAQVLNQPSTGEVDPIRRTLLD